MASVPFAIVQALSSGVATTAGSSRAGGSLPTKIGPDNQANDISFLGLMKRIKVTGDDKTLDGLLGSMNAPNAPNAPTPDGTLPSAGMILPLALTQGALPGQLDSSILDDGGSETPPVLQPATSPASDTIQALKETLVNAVSAGEKLPATVRGPQMPAVGITDEVAARTVAADSTSALKSPDLFAKLSESHNVQNSTLGLVNNLSAEIVSKHPENTDLSHAALAATGALPHGIDKANQSATVPSITISPKTPGWGDELGNRIMWMVHQDVQTANIKLNPPHLGPLEVNVSLSNNQVDVSFSSHHASVKEALDASIPKLREMLGDNGLQLGGANVTHRSFSEQQQGGNQPMNYQYNQEGDNGINASNAGMAELGVSAIDALGNGMIDLFA